MVEGGGGAYERFIAAAFVTETKTRRNRHGEFRAVPNFRAARARRAAYAILMRRRVITARYYYRVGVRDTAAPDTDTCVCVYARVHSSTTGVE